MKKLNKPLILISLLIISFIIIIFLFKIYNGIFKPNVKQDTFFYIKTGSDFETVKNDLIEKDIITNINSFIKVAEIKKYNKNIRSGRYRLKKGMNNNELINLLRSGKQTPVKLTFNNIRTIEDFAGKVSKKLEFDSLQLISLLKNKEFISEYGFNEQNIIGMFIPDTYEIWWNITPENFIKRMKTEYDRFWNESRINKAKKLNLTKKEVSVLASIVQAEQLAHPDERPKVAGLYINRLKRGMLLQSDPTLIFASGDFSKKRVLNKDKEIESPYNTYKYAGLPPGPVNMPDKSSIDAVLNYERHNYIFMCAKEDFSGYHNFSTNARQHSVYAKKYQQALNKRKIWK